MCKAVKDKIETGILRKCGTLQLLKKAALKCQAALAWGLLVVRSGKAFEDRESWCLNKPSEVRALSSSACTTVRIVRKSLAFEEDLDITGLPWRQTSSDLRC